MEIIIKIQIDGIEEKDVKVKTEIKRETVEQDAELEDRNISQYARFFDDACVGWTQDPEYNLNFLICQQEYCNRMLEERRHLFLNEVYDKLGIPRTKAGAVVGWIYDEKHPHGDNCVDFSLYSERNRDFINGYARTALLDFNVDGNILDYI